MLILITQIKANYTNSITKFVSVGMHMQHNSPKHRKTTYLSKHAARSEQLEAEFV